MRTLTSLSRHAARAGGLGATALVAAAASLVLACRGDAPQSTAVSDDLRRDLELASTATVTLPEQSQRTRFVSAVERGPDPVPSAESRDRTKARVPTSARARRAPARAAGARHGEAAASVASAVQEAPAPTTAAEPVSSAPAEAAPAPTVAAAPEPAPEVHEPGMGAGSGPNAGGEAQGGSGGRGSEGHGRGIGDIFGGVIGVVIRGGAVGDGDHCERDRPRRGRGGYPPIGIPGNIPVMGPGQYPMPRGGRFPGRF